MVYAFNGARAYKPNPYPDIDLYFHKIWKGAGDRYRGLDMSILEYTKVKTSIMFTNKVF